MPKYDHRQPTRFTEVECRASTGRYATLTLTGVIDEVCVSDAGPFVMFKVDERWGFGDHRIGIDLDALEARDA